MRSRGLAASGFALGFAVGRALHHDDRAVSGADEFDVFALVECEAPTLGPTQDRFALSSRGTCVRACVRACVHIVVRACARELRVSCTHALIGAGSLPCARVRVQVLPRDTPPAGVAAEAAAAAAELPMAELAAAPAGGEPPGAPAAGVGRIEPAGGSSPSVLGVTGSGAWPPPAGAVAGLGTVTGERTEGRVETAATFFACISAMPLSFTRTCAFLSTSAFVTMS